MCKHLYCQLEEKCRTNKSPAADGTPCGTNKWCFDKECVPIGKHDGATVPGGWSDWSEYSSCNRECGAGIQVSERECNSPMPRNKGQYCVGERKRFRICNERPCTGVGSPSFRDVQCAKHSGNGHEWKSYIESNHVCALYCVQNGSGKLKKFAEHAENGTPCKAGANDMCIEGECRVSVMTIYILN
jgi:a disintegrin and metalloproteinase with thrombospondin motifs 7